jgi:hypothetical protein
MEAELSNKLNIEKEQGVTQKLRLIEPSTTLDPQLLVDWRSVTENDQKKVE